MRYLTDYRCPIHGRDLEEAHEPDGDETGVWMHTYYVCPEGHTYPAHCSPGADPVPVDEEGDEESA